MQVTLKDLQLLLAENNRRYVAKEIDRPEWVATNQRLAGLAKPLGVTLPPFALGQDNV